MDTQNRRDLVFALDIGTRSVIGLIAVQEGSILRIIDMEYREHTQRAMVDGQIEDIDQAARICRDVKEALEDRNGLSLSNVSVAAAGRALKTVTATAEINYDQRKTITAQAVIELETAAVENAQRELSVDGITRDVRCVGYTVVRNFVDDYPISSLKDHKAMSAKVEIIATFLPLEVVDSLYSTMRKIGLNIASLTLEPIAAMNAIIPDELRLLNLALVDIGAGTSDIAISDSGSIVAYTMATVAGDEITESIMQNFLVDFATAERMKMEMGTNTTVVSYQSILGFEGKISPEELAEEISPAIENLAKVIAQRILEANGKPPSAVFVVGGGSQTNTLCDRMSEYLQIDRAKIGVGRNNYMKSQVASDKDVFGPQFATPVGIALTTVLNRKNSYIVMLNGEEVTVDSSIDTLMDLLSFKGYKHDQIMGRSGSSIFFTVGEEKQFFRGASPEPAKIVMNGTVAGLTANLADGSVIEFTPAQNGENAAPTVFEIIGRRRTGSIKLMGREVQIGHRVTVGGACVDDDYKICDGDVLELTQVLTLGELCSVEGIEPNPMTVNGYLYDLNRRLSDGDVVEMQEIEIIEPIEILKETPVKEAGIHYSLPDDVFAFTVTGSKRANEEVNAAMDLLYSVDEDEGDDVAVDAAFATMEEFVKIVKKASYSETEAGEEDFEDVLTEAFTEEFPMGFVEAIAESSLTELPADALAEALANAFEADAEELDDCDCDPGEINAILAGEKEPEETVNNPYIARILASRAHGEGEQTKPSPILPPTHSHFPEEPSEEEKPQSSQELVFAPGLQPRQKPRMVEPTGEYEPENPPAVPYRREVKITLNGQEKILPPTSDGSSYMFLHMLNFVDIDPSKPKGDIVLLHNGERASYVAPVLNGDKIEIRWETDEN